MVLHGHIKNGRIEVDDTGRLPEGARVRIEVLETESPKPDQVAEASQRIRELRKGNRLDGLSIRQMIEEGRRF